MKKKIFGMLKNSSIFMLGLIIGAILMNLLHMYVSPTFRENIRINFNAEQRFLAARAARQGNTLRALSHQWNVVDSEAINGFRSFQRERNKEDDTSFFLPFALFVMDAVAGSSGGMQGRGARISEGIERGKLAFYLEEAGQTREAQIQWELAQKLTGRQSIEDVRKTVLTLKKQESTDLHLEAERVVLGDDAVNK